MCGSIFTPDPGLRPPHLLLTVAESEPLILSPMIRQLHQTPRPHEDFGYGHDASGNFGGRGHPQHLWRGGNWYE